jgi:glycosyltransferase involved in cell wall biosynthesis
MPTRTPLRVTRVIAKLEPGGAQLGLFRLSRALRRHGVLEGRLLAGDASAEGIALARDHGLEVEAFAPGNVGGIGGPDLQWTPSGDFAAWLEPRLQAAELVHAHMFGGWWAAAQVVPDPVPLVASEHNPLTWPDRPHDAEAREALRRVDLFFAHGPAAHEQIARLGLPPERLVRGRGSIGGTRLRPKADLPSPRLVYAGRHAWDKGTDILVEALGRMRSPPLTFLLGDGPLRRELEERARELRLDGRAIFTGWQREPGRWVAGATALVVPSREEAWSQSAVQAMAAGTPVVGAAVEALPDVLGEGRGILVAPEDPEALAEALADVLAGRRVPDLAAARSYAAEFTPAAAARTHVAAYRELVARRARAAEPVTAQAVPAPGARPSSA